MNSRPRKSMDGLRPSSRKRTSQPRSFPRESFELNRDVQVQESSLIDEKSKVITNQKNKKYISQKNIGQGSIKKILLRFFSNRKLYWFIIKITIAISIIISIGNYYQKTSISIQPHIEYQDINIQTKIYRNPQDNQLGFDVIAVTDEVSISTKDLLQEIQGQDTLTESYMTGTIILKNNYSEEAQELFGGTRIISETGNVFVLPQGTTIIPGKKENKAGEIEVIVTALEPGEYSILKKSTFTIPGFKELGFEDKFKLITGTAKYSFEMTTENTQASSEPNLQTFDNDLNKALLDRLTKRLKLEKTDEFIVLRGSEKILAQPTSYLADGDSGLVTKRGTIFALLIGNEAISDYLMSEHIQVPEGQFFTIVNPSVLNIHTNVQNIDYEHISEVSIDISGRPLFESKIDKEELSNKILSLTKEQIPSIISTNPRFDKVHVTIRPFWKKTATSDISKMNIVIRK